MQLVLDTSAYSHFRGGHEGVLDLMARATTISLPTIVLGELEAAFRLGRRTADNRVRLREFLDEDFVSVLPVTSEVAHAYGELFAKLRTAGTPIPVNDIWIAACAIDAGAHLVTLDSDFRRIGSLDCTILKP